MPCIQVTDKNIPYDPPISSQLGPFTSEAECLEACKEGACCEGDSCSVKPKCQCVCQDGSCCGPDTITVVAGTVDGIKEITGPRCRDSSEISREDCIKNGGTWRCNVPCTLIGGDLENGVQKRPCGSLLGKDDPVFIGVGTTCTPTPCCCVGKPSVAYSYGPVDNPPTGEIEDSKQVISVPDDLGLPVTLQFCGTADDGFAIDGKRISSVGQNPPNMEMSKRTFTISIINDGGPAVGNVTICFIENECCPENESLPTALKVKTISVKDINMQSLEAADKHRAVLSSLDFTAEFWKKDDNFGYRFCQLNDGTISGDGGGTGTGGTGTGGTSATNFDCCAEDGNTTITTGGINTTAVPSVRYSYGPVFNNVPIGEIVESRQTITVPNTLSLPVLLKFCGSGDDGFAIDGNRISTFARTPPDMQMNNRTFTISLWNDGGPAVGSLKICFVKIGDGDGGGGGGGGGTAGGDWDIYFYSLADKFSECNKNLTQWSLNIGKFFKDYSPPNTNYSKNGGDANVDAYTETDGITIPCITSDQTFSRTKTVSVFPLSDGPTSTNYAQQCDPADNRDIYSTKSNPNIFEITLEYTWIFKNPLP